MKIEQQPLDSCELQLTIELDTAQIEEAKRKAARKLAQKYAIPGFRKGKAPYEIVLRTVGEGNVLETALDDLTQDVYQKAIEELNLDPIGPGQMADAKLDPPVFTFTVPLRPQIDLGEYRNIRLGYSDASVTEEALDETLEHMREHEAVLEPVERPAQHGDVVTVDVAGKLILEPAESGGEPASAEPAPESGAEASSAPAEEFLVDDKDVELLLDPKLNWPAPGFAEKLAGISVDENRPIELVFPDDYANESLRGKRARFEVKCKGVKSRTLPEWDDELAKSLGEYESLADLREKVHDILLSQARRRVNEEYARSAVDIMVAGAAVKFPPYLLERELDDMVNDLDRRLREQNLTLEDYKKIRDLTDEKIREDLEPHARERLRRTLALAKVIELERLTVDEREVNTRIEIMSTLLGKEADRYRKLMRDDRARRSVRYDLLSERAVQRVVAIAKGENPPLEIVQEAQSVEEAAATPAAEPAPEAAAEPEGEAGQAA